MEPKEQELLELLKEQVSIGNGKAIQQLGWTTATYEKVKQNLLQKGLIAQGRGRGGSIRLVGFDVASNGLPTLQHGNTGARLEPGEPSSRLPTLQRGNSVARLEPGGPSKARLEPGEPSSKRRTNGSHFEQAFRNIDDVLWKDSGCGNELDYTEQTSWVLFLKYLDDLETVKAIEADLEGRKYTPIIEAAYRWPVWACPKTADGKIDHHKALTGDDLIEFVERRLFPYLKGFKQKATGPDTIEYKIGEIFGELNNKVKSGYNLREVLEHVDELQFQSQQQKHELSDLYEGKIQRMGNAGRNGGEYYTPRPLIRAIVQVVDPKIGETIYDGAVGSAGFLCEAFEHLKAKAQSTTDHATLQRSTFHGKEKKSLAYVIGIMNMILHGIEAPNIVHTNTLAENLQDIQPRDQHDVVLANPPFGGKERKEVQQNFPIKTGETAFLFLQHFIKSLKAGGRAGIVIKNTFLSNTDNASISLRRKLLQECDLHTILDMPQGTFQGAGVKTVVLFFEKGRPTRKIWYYQLDPGRSMGKTSALNDADMAEFVALQKTKADSPKSWSVDVADILGHTERAEVCDLSVKNPNRGEEVALRDPKTILQEMRQLDEKTKGLLDNIMQLIG